MVACINTSRVPPVPVETTSSLERTSTTPSYLHSGLATFPRRLQCPRCQFLHGGHRSTVEGCPATRADQGRLRQRCRDTVALDVTQMWLRPCLCGCSQAGRRAACDGGVPYVSSIGLYGMSIVGLSLVVCSWTVIPEFSHPVRLRALVVRRAIPRVGSHVQSGRPERGEEIREILLPSGLCEWYRGCDTTICAHTRFCTPASVIQIRSLVAWVMVCKLWRCQCHRTCRSVSASPLPTAGSWRTSFWNASVATTACIYAVTCLLGLGVSWFWVTVVEEFPRCG